MRKINKNIIEWANQRGLLIPNNQKKQFNKLLEEVEELRVAIETANLEEIVDSIGDIQVVLTILAKQYSLDVDKCLESAYNEIKDRQGTTINGIFVKEVK